MGKGDRKYRSRVDKRGRPPKAGKRFPNGELVVSEPMETEAQILSTAHYQRRKQMVEDGEWSALIDSPRAWRDPRRGYVLGRLRLRDTGICDDQLEAGKRYTEIDAMWRISQGLPSLHPHAIDLNAVRGSSLTEPTDEQIHKWKEQLDDCETCLRQAARENLDYTIPAVVKRVCLENKYPSKSELCPNPVGSLRLGLNALARELGIISQAA